MSLSFVLSSSLSFAEEAAWLCGRVDLAVRHETKVERLGPLVRTSRTGVDDSIVTDRDSGGVLHSDLLAICNS